MQATLHRRFFGFKLRRFRPVEAVGFLFLASDFEPALQTRRAPRGRRGRG